MPAPPVKNATHQQARRRCQVGLSQQQEEPSPQLGAILDYGALGAAESTEPGALHQEKASPAPACSSLPDQVEAQGVSHLTCISTIVVILCLHHNRVNTEHYAASTTSKPRSWHITLQWSATA